MRKALDGPATEERSTCPPCPPAMQVKMTNSRSASTAPYRYAPIPDGTHVMALHAVHTQAVCRCIFAWWRWRYYLCIIAGMFDVQADRLSQHWRRPVQSILFGMCGMTTPAGRGSQAAKSVVSRQTASCEAPAKLCCWICSSRCRLGQSLSSHWPAHAPLSISSFLSMQSLQAAQAADQVSPSVREVWPGSMVHQPSRRHGNDLVARDAYLFFAGIVDLFIQQHQQHLQDWRVIRMLINMEHMTSVRQRAHCTARIDRMGGPL